MDKEKIKKIVYISLGVIVGLILLYLLEVLVFNLIYLIVYYYYIAIMV